MKRLFFILILLPSLAFSQSGGVGFWTSASSAPPPVQTVTNYMPVGDLEVVPIVAPGATYPYNFYVADYVRSVIIQYTGDAVVPKNGTVVAGVLDNPGVGGPYLKNPTKIKKMSYSSPESGVFFVLHDDNKRVSRFDLGTNNMTDVAVSDYIYDFAPDPTNPSVVYTIEENNYINILPWTVAGGYSNRYKSALKISKYSGGVLMDMAGVLSNRNLMQSSVGGSYSDVNWSAASQSISLDYIYGGVVMNHMLSGNYSPPTPASQVIWTSVASYSPVVSNPLYQRTQVVSDPGYDFTNPPSGVTSLSYTSLPPGGATLPIMYFSLPYTDISNQVPVYIISDPYDRAGTLVAIGSGLTSRLLSEHTYRIGAVPNLPAPLSPAVPSFFIDTRNRNLYRHYTHINENTTHLVSTGLSSSPLWN